MWFFSGIRHLRAGLPRLAIVVLASVIAMATGVRGASAWEMRVCADPYLLPFSHADGSGFDNRIAKLLADAVDADLTFVWIAQTSDMVSKYLRVGECDVIIGVQDGQQGLLSTLSLYRSPFVFVQRADRPYRVNMFDDPVLRDLRIGVQHAGSPVHEALVKRGLRDNLARAYEYGLARIIEDVAAGEIEVGIAFGPTVGYFAAQQSVPLVISPVTPIFEPPFRPMFINIAVGVRQGDESLRDLLDIAIAKQWDEINAILQDYHVPTMPLQRPIATIGGP